MENDLPNGSNSGNSLFGKIKERLSGIPIYLWAFIFIGVVASFLIAIYYLAPDIFRRITERITKEEKIENVWSAYTTTPPPIATGIQLYRISGGDPTLPVISEVIVDPLDPQVGQNQTVTVKANGPTPIKEVIVRLRLDNENNFEYKLAPSAGTSTNGEWKGSWNFPYSYNLTYRFNVVTRNENNLGNVATITIR